LRKRWKWPIEIGVKFLVIILIAAGVGAGVAWRIASNQGDTRFQAELDARDQAWQAEKAKLESSFKAQLRLAAGESTAPKIIETVKPASPAEILGKLVKLQVRPGPGQNAAVRQVVQELENLVECGPGALPAIRDFLGRNEEFDYEEDVNEFQAGWRDARITMDFIVPPSLRLGMLRAVARIGGPDAEKILADVQSATGRGVEVAFTALLLDELAPGKYRDASLAAAHELLQTPVITRENAQSRLDRNDRTWLYNLLVTFQDGTLGSLAQSQLVHPDGRLDPGSLRYLKETLKEKSIPILMQAYADTRLKDPIRKDQLVQVALAYAGVDEQAGKMLAMALGDASLPLKVRMDELAAIPRAGLEDQNKPTDRDLQIMENRVQILENIKNGLSDTNFAAQVGRAGQRLSDWVNNAKQAKARAASTDGKK
jgi:hypothetical protein